MVKGFPRRRNLVSRSTSGKRSSGQDAQGLPTLQRVRVEFRGLEEHVSPQDTVFIALTCDGTWLAANVEGPYGVVIGDEDDLNDQAVVLYEAGPPNQPLTCLIDD